MDAAVSNDVQKENFIEVTLECMANDPVYVEEEHVNNDADEDLPTNEEPEVKREPIRPRIIGTTRSST